MKPQTSNATSCSQAGRFAAERRERASARHGQRSPLPLFDPARALSLICRFVAVAVVLVFAGPNPVQAAPDWTLVCPQGGSGEPQYRDQRGRVFAIRNPGERALADKLCGVGTLGAAENYTVSVTNNGANTIYVAFTDYSTQLPGPITWTNCSVVNSQAVVATNTTCTAQVPTTAGITRFCASTTQVPTGQSPNCNLAQARNQTMIETNFGTGSNGVCYPASLSSCVWYDISVIPQNCTPAAWSQNYCQNTGGASYNLPVSLASSGQNTYTCQGPPSTTPPYSSAGYPSNCGNPAAGCVGNSPSCDNAYFWPTPSPEPNSEAQGQTLQIAFLSGP